MDVLPEYITINSLRQQALQEKCQFFSFADGINFAYNHLL